MKTDASIVHSTRLIRNQAISKTFKTKDISMGLLMGLLIAVCASDFAFMYVLHSIESPVPRVATGLVNAVVLTVAIYGIVHFFVSRPYSSEIAQRRQIEESLRESEQRYRTLIETSPDAITLVNLNAVILMCNPQTLKLLGYEDEGQLRGRNAIELVVPEERQQAADHVKAVVETGTARNIEHRVMRKDGSSVAIEISGSLIMDSAKKPESILVFMRDITERKRVEEAKRESEERFRSAFDQAAIGMALVAPNGHFLKVNSSLCGIVGYSEPELLVMDFQSITHPDDLGPDLDYVRQIIAGEISSFEMEKRYLHKSGHAVWAHLSASLVLDAGGRPLYFVAQVQDITQRKQAEENLTRSYERLQQVLVETVEAMAFMVEMRDPYTAGHQRRTAQLAAAIAAEMQLSRDQTIGVQMAATIHDIGKIRIPAEILSKPGKLNDIEFRMIKTHPQIGCDVLHNIEFPWPIAQIVLQHHERMNGSGYPRGEKGEGILLEARILAVADVVEAMASHRPYRPALGIDEALREIASGRNVLYDSAVVDACLRVFAGGNFKFE